MGLFSKLTALTGLFAAGCSLVQTHVSVENQATAPVTDARLTAVGQEIWSGTLNPGETKAIQFAPAGDGSFELTGTLNGAPLNGKAFGYTTPHDSTKHALHIDPQGNVAYTTAR